MAMLTPKGGRQVLRLKISDAPKNPFVDHEFPVSIHLVDDSGQLKCGDEIPLILKLCFQEKPLRPCPDNLLVVKNAENPDQDPKDFKIAKTGSIRLIVRINELSMRYDNKKLVLHASTESVNGLYVQSAISPPMLCVRYRLVIENQNLPDVWFKDEGGRDKCIELNVSLRDHKNDKIVERRVPLKVVLLYADGGTVLKQEILKISPDSKLHLDGQGQASLRLRIDDVSKNHQKQSFVIQIAPDTNSNPLNNDISPDECSPLEVRSKRNKGKRPRDDDSSNAAPVNAAAQKIANNSSRPAPATTTVTSNTTAPISTTSRQAFPHPKSAPEDKSSVPQTVIEKTAKENKRLNDLVQRYETAERHNDASRNKKVGDAISGLVEWSQATMEAIASLQWQYIGNEKLHDGTTRPLYEMTNPNQVITELFHRFHDVAVPGLTLLFNSHFSSENGSSEGNASRQAESESSNKPVVPGYIPLPKGSPATFSGLPLNSPLNVNFPSPACHSGGYFHGATSFSNISKNFSTDSKFSQASAVTLGLPGGNTTREKEVSRFSSTSSSVSNPSGALAMSSLERNVSTASALADCLPAFGNSTTAELLQQWGMGLANGIEISSSAQSHANVYYILSKRFYSKLVSPPLDCPAFDMDKKLIGFFVSKSDKSSRLEATSATFTSLEDYPANLFTPSEVKAANAYASKVIDANAGEAFLRAYYCDESTFIEDAIIKLYESPEDIDLSSKAQS